MSFKASSYASIDADIVIGRAERSIKEDREELAKLEAVVDQERDEHNAKRNRNRWTKFWYGEYRNENWDLDAKIYSRKEWIARALNLLRLARNASDEKVLLSASDAQFLGLKST